MDFYEELGLPPTASADEIRRAYKRLAMHLHPDRCSTDLQKRRAEARMRRLNEIFETLGDTGQRQRHDDARREAAIRDAAQQQHQHLLLLRQKNRNKLWISAFGLCATGLVIAGLFFTDTFERGDQVFPRLGAPVDVPVASVTPKSNRPAAAANKRDPELASPPMVAVPVKPPEAPRQIARSLDPTTETPAPRLRELANARPSSSSAPIEPLVNTNPRLIEGNTTASSTTVVARPATPASSVAGTWIFSPWRSPGTNLPYAAEYVEVSIRMQRQRVTGRFQGRFNVRNSTLPPRVVFQFEGAEQDLATGILWRAENGAEGVVKLHLLSEKELELGWYTTRFAATLALTSGSAILSREPIEN